MGYQQSHAVIAIGQKGQSRVMGPFTSEERASDFLDRLARRPGTESVDLFVIPIRKPKVIESAAALREWTKP